MRNSFLPLAIAAGLVAPSLAQSTLVIPNGMAAAEGSTANAFPWGRGGSGIRMQQIYDSANFTLQGVNYPVVITRLRWRPNTNVSSVASSYPTGATVMLSTAPVDQSVATTNFASNQGADLTTVFSGPVTWPAATAVAGPCPFLIDIPFTTPFVYDPNLGDLNIETDIPVQTFTGTGLQLDIEGTNPMACRVYLTTGYANGAPNAVATGVTTSHGVVVEVTYAAAVGLFPSFAATPTSGTSPLLVQFTDHTFTSDPNGVLAWQWDFDGDTVIDSTLQNPSFTYTACGNYNVSLTTTDATHGSVTTTRNGFITVDPLSADFTATPSSGGSLPLIVQFTDASTNATTWAWDFDNDSVVDSTAQNPVWVYATPGTYSVHLAVTNACRSDSITKPDMILVGGIIVPAADQSVDGNSSNAFPFDTTAIRMQNVVDSSHFISQGATGPILISHLRMRANSSTVTWTGSSINSLQVDLSTCPVDFTVASATFASNHGADQTTVFNGPFAIPAGSSTLGVPGPFYIDIPLSPPFLFNPQQGDLTIDYTSSGVLATANTPTPDAETTTGVAMAKRIYSSTITSPTGTLTTGEHINVLEFDFVPATGLFPAFSATPTTGASPLAVQFTDQTYSSDPGGVVSWQWDLDGDTIVDSTLQNPSFVYTVCGSYTVSLTVVDASHGATTLTKPNYIVTDELTVGFTKQDMGGGVFQFTDTSTPVPQTWAWDFNGDNIVDSTLQNPTFAYTADCATNVITLTATLNCRTGSASDSAFVSPASFASTPTTNNGNSSTTAVGNMFDVSVTAPDGISVCALTVKPYSFSGPFTLSVYVTPGTYVGKHATAAAWRQVGSGSGVANAGTSSAPSIVDVALASSFYLPAGNYGVAVYLSALTGSTNIAYTNALQGPFSNADLTFFPVPATAPGIATLGLFSTSTTASRCWSGKFHYTKVSLTNTGGYGFFGAGCAGTAGISNLTAAARPALGQTLSVTADHLPLNIAVGVIGFSNTTSVLGALPLDLGSFGAPGCFARVSPDAYTVLTGTGGSLTWNLSIPNVPTLLAARAYQQMLVFDTAANGLGIVASDAAGFVIGQ